MAWLCPPRLDQQAPHSLTRLLHTTPMQSSTAAPPPPLASAAGVNLRALIESKQHELAVIHDYQSRALASDNASLQAALATAQQRYDKLKSDFAYNLDLLSARDQELARYDALSVEYAHTLAAKSEEAAERVRALEAKLEARSMAGASLDESNATLRARISALEEQLAAASWSAEAERRALQANAARATKDLEAQLRDKEESASKTQYELLFNFERGVHDERAKAQADLERVEALLKKAKSDLDASALAAKKTEEKLQVESHRRSTVEARLAETDQKLVASEALVGELRAQAQERLESHSAEQLAASQAHESLLQKCVADYKALTGQVEKMQSAAQSQAEQHAEATSKVRREAERQMNELASSYTKQLHAAQQELQLTQQQLADARTLASSVQAELDGMLAADRARSSTLQGQLSDFQSQHAKQLQDLHHSLWQSEEEKKSLAEKHAATRRHLDERRVEVQAMKDALAAEQRKVEDLERAAVARKLKDDRTAEETEENIATLKAQIKAAADAHKLLQADRDSQRAKAEQTQALTEEYEKQLKAARDELLALHRAEEEQLERRLAGGPAGAVQQQLQQLGGELSNMSTHLRANTKPPTHPSSAHILSLPSSARSLAFQQQQQPGQQILSQRSGNITPPDQSDLHSRRQRQRSQQGFSQRSQRPSSSLSPSRPVHSPRPFTPAFSDDMGPASLPGSMPTSPQPINVQQRGGSGGGGGGGVREALSPRVVIEAPLIDMLSNSHHALQIETHLPPASRAAQMQMAHMKQSVTSPNINLNHGQSSLENMPSAIAEHKSKGSRRGGSGNNNNEQDSDDSDNDFVEHPMTDSSSDNDESKGGAHSGQHRRKHAKSRSQSHTQPMRSSHHSVAARSVDMISQPLQVEEHDMMEEQMMQSELVEEHGSGSHTQQQQFQAQEQRRLSPRSERASLHSSHSTEDSQVELERSLRRLRSDNATLSAQNTGLSGIIRQMKRELEQLMSEQTLLPNQAQQRSASESSKLQQLEQALASKSREVDELRSAPLHPFYAPQFPPPPSSYGSSPLGYGPVPPLQQYPPFGSSFELQHLHQERAIAAAAAARDSLLQTQEQQERQEKARRRQEAREEQAAGAAAAQAATAEFDRRYEEQKEQQPLSSSARIASARIRAPTAYDDGSIKLSLSATGVMAQVSNGGGGGGASSGRREMAFHSSDRATESQREASRALRIRAEILRKKDESIKARADAARAKVREQMKRNKQVELDRQRAAMSDHDA